jgi:cell division initiation protein
VPLTPMDIHNKEFSRSFRGYKEDEVDQFLDNIVDDFEKLYTRKI